MDKLDLFTDAARRLDAVLSQENMQNALRRCGFEDQAVTILWGLYVRQKRFLLSVVELANNGQAPAANVLCRSMFETMLAVGFIAKPKWGYRVSPDFCRKHLKRVRTKALILRPSHTQRANLFLAHHIFETDRLADNNAKVRGLRSVAAAYRAMNSDEIRQRAKESIGRDWEIILKQQKSYSGMNSEQLARSIGTAVYRYYRAIVGFQSGFVHSVDITNYFQLDHCGLSGTWEAARGQCAMSIWPAMQVTITMVGLLDEWHDIGIVLRTALDQLIAESVGYLDQA